MIFVLDLIAVLPLLVSSLDKKLQKIPITCDAGTFVAGQPASVTCNFHRDMNADRRGINVVRHSLDASDNDPGTDVLSCGWKDETKHYSCIPGNGAMFDDSITDRLTIHIPAVSQQYQGLYTCFIITSKETQQHACELSVKGSDRNTTPPSKPGENGTIPHDPFKTDESSHLWIIAIPIVFAVVALTVALFWKRTIWDKRQRNNDPADQGAAEPLLPSGDQSTSSKPTTSQDKLATILKDLSLSISDCERVCKHLSREFVSSSVSASNCIKKYLSEHTMPKGTEKGGFLSIGLASHGVDIRHVVLSGPQTEIQSARYDLQTHAVADDDLMSFFFAVADCVKQFLKANKLTYKAFPVEFLFCSPFGVEREVTMERLREYTTGLVCDEDMDRDPNDMLQQALRKINVTRRLRIKPIVKDPEGTLLAGAYRDPGCAVAILSSVELPACYTSKTNAAEQKEKITTVDFGALGETGVLDILRTNFDTELDRSSEIPGEKILEKMVSWRYMGELLRLVLLELVKERKLSMTVPDSSALCKKDGLTVTQFCLIQSDADGQNGMTELVLDELKVENHTPEDCDIVRNACKTIVQRSAYLTAAVLAALVAFLKKPKLKIAVDGFMCRDNPEFQHMVEDKTKELLPEDLRNFQFSPQYHGRRVGAAVVALRS